MINQHDKKAKRVTANISRERLMGLVDGFRNKRVLVVGDVMLDRFVYGLANRLSQEAPVPVLDFTDERYCLGGAANVAAHMVSFGASAFLVGVVGSDKAHRQVLTGMREMGLNTSGLVVDESRPTTEKTRIVARSQQIVRIDIESRNKIEKRVETVLIDMACKNLAKSSALIFVDYGKGTVTGKLARSIIKEGRKLKIPILINPKHEFKMFKGATLFTPNEKEAREMTGEERVSRSVERIKHELKCAVLVTEGERGMTLHDTPQPVHFAAKAREVFDEAGASDTVTATLAVALACGADMAEAAYLSNLAAGIVVGKPGVATVNTGELLVAVEEDPGLAG